MNNIDTFLPIYVRVVALRNQPSLEIECVNCNTMPINYAFLRIVIVDS